MVNIKRLHNKCPETDQLFRTGGQIEFIDQQDSLLINSIKKKKKQQKKLSPARYLTGPITWIYATPF